MNAYFHWIAFAVKTNDMMLVIYLSSLIRSVIALHNLINNKVTLSLQNILVDPRSFTSIYGLWNSYITLLQILHLVLRCSTKNTRKLKMQSQLQFLLSVEADFVVSSITALPLGWTEPVISYIWGLVTFLNLDYEFCIIYDANYSLVSNC